MPALSVVLPVWNEEHRLAAGLLGLAELRRHVGEEVEAVIVDDGSTDGTLAAAHAAVGPGDRVLAEPHRGKGGALRAGVMAATGDRVLLADIDWSVPPGQALLLADADADLVVATREGAGARRIGEPVWRHLLGRAFNQLVQGTVLAGHTDTQCGCKLLRRDVAHVLFERLTVEGWAYDVELLTLAHSLGFSVREVPVVWRFEADSRLRPVSDGVAMARELRRIRRNAREGVYRRR
jgi:glycosyltransferase involved in cell wall biosynthesis